MATTAGSITVDLLMKTSSFSTDAKRAEKSLDDLSKKAVIAGTAIGVALVAAGTAMAVMVKKSIDNMDAMSKLAQSTGTTTEKLSALAYAADLSGVNQEALGSAMVKLTKNMSDAAMGTGEAIKGFAALGIAFKDSSGNLRANDEVLGDIAEKFANMQDGAGKTALAVNLFGKSGAQMIPLLNAGRDGLADMAAEAEKLGVVMSTSAAQAAEAFNDNLTRLHKSIDGFSIQVATAVLPVMNDFIQAFIDTRNESNKMLDAARDLSKDNSIQDWAQNTALVLSVVYDAASTVVDGLIIVGSSVRAMALDSKAALASVANLLPEWGITGLMAKGAGLDISDEGTKKIVDQAAKARADIERQLKAIWNKPLLYDTLKENFANDDLRLWGGSGSAFKGAKQLAPILVKPDDGGSKKPANGSRDYVASSLDEYLIRIGEMDEAMDGLGVTTEKTFDKMGEFSVQAARNIQQSLGDGLYGLLSGNFDDIGSKFSDMLLRMAADAAAANLAKAMFGDYDKTGAIGGIIGQVAGSLFGNSSGNLSGSSLSGASWNTSVGWGDGGYTGAGGKNDPAGIVHKGEVVFSQSDVSRHGGVGAVEAMRLRGYANGGVVGGGAAASSAGVVLNITNQGQPVSATQPKVNMDEMGRMVISFMISDAQRNGPYIRQLKGAM